MKTRIKRGFEPVIDTKMKRYDNQKTLYYYPQRGTKFSAGYDFKSPVEFTLLPRETFKVYTNIKAYMLGNEYLDINIRSSQAIKNNLRIKGSVGIIDCVPKGTKISTPKGYKLIEDIFNNNKKEEIISYNEEFNCLETDQISDCWIVEDKELIEIVLINNKKIKIPIEKEVFTERGWIKAKDLTIDDKILTI